MQSFGVQTVYHAAAYKHVPLVEHNPIEGVRNNSVGTRRMAEAALAAGVETFVHLVDDERTWTCGKGVYAKPVAEMALALALAGMRGVGGYARERSWAPPRGTNLYGANVTILGGGGITEALIELLQPFKSRITVVRNHVQEMRGVDEVVQAAVDGVPVPDRD